MPDELSCEEGDLIKVLAKGVDGWSQGENTRSNAVGMYPDNYTRAATPEDIEKLTSAIKPLAVTTDVESEVRNAYASKPVPTAPVDDRISSSALAPSPILVPAVDVSVRSMDDPEVKVPAGKRTPSLEKVSVKDIKSKLGAGIGIFGAAAFSKGSHGVKSRSPSEDVSTPTAGGTGRSISVGSAVDEVLPKRPTRPASPTASRVASDTVTGQSVGALAKEAELRASSRKFSAGGDSASTAAAIAVAAASSVRVRSSTTAHTSPQLPQFPFSEPMNEDRKRSLTTITMGERTIDKPVSSPANTSSSRSHVSKRLPAPPTKSPVVLPSPSSGPSSPAGTPILSPVASETDGTRTRAESSRSESGRLETIREGSVTSRPTSKKLPTPPVLSPASAKAALASDTVPALESFKSTDSEGDMARPASPKTKKTPPAPPTAAPAPLFAADSKHKPAPLVTDLEEDAAPHTGLASARGIQSSSFKAQLSKLAQFSSSRDMLSRSVSEESSPKPDKEIKTPRSADREKTRHQRNHVVDEIIATEESYVASLEKVITDYRDVLMFTVYPGAVRVMSNPAIAVMFATWEQMLNINSLFLDKLRTRRKESGGMDVIPMADIFSDFAPLFRIYGVYASMHDESSTVLNDSIDKDPELAALVGLELENLLIKPVQRVPRYMLLLKELKKNTPEEDPEFFALDKATDRMGLTAMSINDAVREREMFHALFKVQVSFAPDSKNLMAPRRSLILAATPMTRISYSESKKLQFLLFNDMLIIASSSSSGLKLQGAMELQGLHVNDIPPIPSMGIKNCFALFGDQMSFLVQTADPEEKSRWLSGIRKALADIEPKAIASHRRVGTAHRAPLLKPKTSMDGVSWRNSCTNCSKEFSENDVKIRCDTCKLVMHKACGKPVAGSEGSICDECMRALLPADAIVVEEEEAVTPSGGPLIRIASGRHYRTKNEHKAKLAQLQMEITGAKHLNLLNDMNRTYVRDGPLIRVQKTGPQLMHCVILSDLFIYGSCDNGVGTCSFVGQFPLYDVVAESIDLGESVNAFTVTYRKVSITFVTHDSVAKSIWMNDIMDAKADLLASISGISVTPRSPASPSLPSSGFASPVADSPRSQSRREKAMTLKLPRGDKSGLATMSSMFWGESLNEKLNPKRRPSKNDLIEKKILLPDEADAVSPTTS